MKLLRTTSNFISRRKVKRIIYGLAFLLLAANFWLLLIYVSQNRNEIVYNRYFKIFLPFYRSVKELSKIAVDSFYIGGLIRQADIPQYGLLIDSADRKKLDESLPDPSADGVISGQILLSEEYKDYIPAKFFHEGREYKVEVRYRGGNANHWTRPKKSWQIKFDKDNLFNGMRVIKLIIPDDREYFAEALNNYRAEKLGLFFPEFKYVRLEVNGGNHGVYYQIEDWSSEFLEKNKKPADANLYATDEISFRTNTEMSVFNSIAYWKKHTADRIFNFDNYAELDFLTNLLNQSNFYEISGDIINLDSFYKWQIVSILSGSIHQGDTGNMRIYFNNSSGKFEFIPWDAIIKSYAADEVTNKLAEKILQNPENLLERNQLLWGYVSNKDNLKDDFAYYDKLYQELKPAFYADWKKHDSNFTFNKRVKEVRQQFEAIFKNTKDLFKQDNSSIVVRYNSEDNIIDLTFKVDNFSGLQLRSITVPVDGVGRVSLYDGSGKLLRTADAKDSEVILDGLDYFLPDFKKSGETTEHNLSVKLSGGQADLSKIEFSFANAVTGNEVKIKDITYIDDTTFSYFSKINLTPQQFVGENGIFREQNGNIILPAGNYYISKNIIVPKNSRLAIMPGTTMNFSKGVSLISYSPIIAEGTASQPIIFQPANSSEPWGSVGIANCGENVSIFNNARFTNGRSAYINGIFFSGMLSSYHSELELMDSIVERSNSDDGINVKYSRGRITGNRFLNNSADAIDFDYSGGIIEGNNFVSNGNDGIDLSDSDVLIKNNNIVKSGDKCISIGERSEGLIIFNNILDGCKIGIETKDASAPIIINNLIVKNKTGVNAYRKKGIYINGGFPKIYNSIIWGNGEQVKDDEYSRTELYNSDVEGGFSGEGNFNQEPNMTGGEYQSFLSGGDRGVLKDNLQIESDNPSVGLYSKF